MSRYRLFVFTLIVGLLSALSLSTVSACGGLFCANIPVAQQGERIIFTINDDETVTAYVQINYTGDAPDFSWVVPVPSVPLVDVAEIATFDEIAAITDPIFMPPPMPNCAPIPQPAMADFDDSDVVEESATAGEVTVLSTGTAGPYAFDVITSDDPDALVVWLRENNYRVEVEMEPFIDVYTAEGMVFLAMKLQPDQGAQDIQPVVMTYNSTQPVIPIRLTAVAANPNMVIQTWVFGDHQAVPTNYAHPEIDMNNMRVSWGSFDGTNYEWLLNQTIDLYQGRAFITEYAQPAENLSDFVRINDELLKDLAENYDYVTRLVGRMSPEEMTADPGFAINDDMRPVSNLYDLTDMNSEIFWGCEDVPIQIFYDESAVPDSFND